MGAPREQEEGTGRRRSSSSFSHQLRGVINEIEEEQEPTESDWANLQLLHHTARLLELSTRQSSSQISALRNQLEAREREVSDLRDQLRCQEARERNLVEQNRLLRVQIMGVGSSSTNTLPLPSSTAGAGGVVAVVKKMADKGVQVSPPTPTTSPTYRCEQVQVPSSFGASPQLQQPSPGMTPLQGHSHSLLPLQLLGVGRGEVHGDDEAVRLEAPPLTSRLPQTQGRDQLQGQTEHHSLVSVRGAGGNVSLSSPTIDRHNFLARRIRRRQTLAHRRRISLDMDFGQNISIPQMRPLIRRRNGLKHGGGQVIGYRWRHYSQHQYLRDPFLPPNPFLAEVEEEEDNLDNNEGEDNVIVDGNQVQAIQIEESAEDEDAEGRDDDQEELSDEEDYDELEVAEVIDVIDLVDDGDGVVGDDEEGDDKKPLLSLVPKVEMAPEDLSDHRMHEQQQQQTSTTFTSPIKNKAENCATPRRSCYVKEEIDDQVADMLEEQEVPTLGKAVEVPQWRQLVLEPIIRDEELEPEPVEEDISEVALLRRHARLELDEKRRKRWDSQRAREETYLEKLKRKMEERENQRSTRRKVSTPGRKGSGKLALGKGKAAKSGSSSGVIGGVGGGAGANVVVASTATTAASKTGVGKSGKAVPPRVAAAAGVNKSGENKNKETDEEGDGVGAKVPNLEEDILYIRVSEDIPVSVFGQLMPIIKKSDFDLPWDDSSPPPSPPGIGNPNNSATLLPTSIKTEPGSGPKAIEHLSPTKISISTNSMTANIKPKLELDLPLSPISTSSENEIVPEVGGGGTTAPSSESRIASTSTPSGSGGSSSTKIIGSSTSDGGQHHHAPPPAPGSPSMLESLLGRTANLTSWLRR